MDKNEILNIFKKRHSVRSYLDKMVSDEDIETILESAKLAPVGLKRDVRRFLVLKKGDPLRTLLDSYFENDVFYSAPVVICVFVKNEAVDVRLDGAASMENMLLCASMLGLGGCWIHAPYKHFTRAKRLDDQEKFGFDSSYTCVGSIIVGYKK